MGQTPQPRWPLEQGVVSGSQAVIAEPLSGSCSPQSGVASPSMTLGEKGAHSNARVLLHNP
jgi:hypothetical protein